LEHERRLVLVETEFLLCPDTFQHFLRIGSVKEVQTDGTNRVHRG
jgi:hypothetical protein